MTKALNNLWKKTRNLKTQPKNKRLFFAQLRLSSIFRLGAFEVGRHRNEFGDNVDSFLQLFTSILTSVIQFFKKKWCENVQKLVLVVVKIQASR